MLMENRVLESKPFKKRSITGFSWFRFIVAILVFGILLQNFLFLRQNRNLQNQLYDTIHKEIEPGYSFTNLAGVNLTGQYIKIEPNNGQKRRLLITFSTGCPACQGNLANWIVLASRLNPDQWQVFWLSRDPLEATAKFCSENNISGQVLSEFSCKNYSQLGLGLVPRTIAVDPYGKVERVWEGQLDEAAWKDVFSYFSSGFR